MPTISIIVPVYNTEKYISRCINSILSQTFYDIEIILIDDGSTDNSGKICDEFVELDKRVRVIHQQNAGVSAARNAGIAIAQGLWIGFVDSDDWIDEKTYETAYNVAVKFDADLVQYSKNKNINQTIIPFNVCEKLELFDSAMWDKIVRKSIFDENNILFPVGTRLSEDEFVSFLCYLYSANCYFINENFYHYEFRDASTSHNISDSMIYEEESIIREMEKAAFACGKKDEYEKIIFHVKELCKCHCIIMRQSPDCKLFRKIFPELNKQLLKYMGKRTVLYWLLFLHLDFFAVVLLLLHKCLKKLLSRRNFRK